MGEFAPTQRKILDSALKVIRKKGFSATTVEDLCAAAQVTKGAFFHYFKSKEDLALKAAEYWSLVTDEFFAKASYKKLKDPLDRVLGYINYRIEIVQGSLPEFTCLVGTMVQETYDEYPVIREACRKSIFGHAGQLALDFKEAKKLHVPNASWDPESLALHTQAVIQGAFILAKAKHDAHVAIQSIEHLRRYIELLFKKIP